MLDPFLLFERAVSDGRIGKAIARRVRDRARYLLAAIKRVERASNLSYPPYYIEPVLHISKSSVELGQLGIMYARVIPVSASGKLSILIEFTAALIAFGSKGTIEAVAAHEFTHYFDLVRRLSKGKILSDERVSALFEARYADSEKVFQPSLILNDKALLKLLARKFKDGLIDDRLNKQVQSKWIDKKLPVRIVSADENIARVSVGSIIGANFDPMLLKRIDEVERKIGIE